MTPLGAVLAATGIGDHVRPRRSTATRSASCFLARSSPPTPGLIACLRTVDRTLRSTAVLDGGTRHSIALARHGLDFLRRLAATAAAPGHCWHALGCRKACRLSSTECVVLALAGCLLRLERVGQWRLGRHEPGRRSLLPGLLRGSRSRCPGPRLPQRDQV